MFVLPGYDAFLGFLLIAAAVPVLALITNAVLAPRDGTYSSVRVLWSRRAAASLVGHMMLATQLAGSRWTPLEERFLRR